MAEGPDYTVAHRRRREKKTDYKKRLELLKSGKPRAVVRRSNNHAQVQFAAYTRDGDEIVASAHSRDLAEYGWDHHTGNQPAAYLTGYLAGTRALDEGIEDAVVDLGLQNTEHKTRIFAAIKGLRDAGVHVNADEETFPDEDRLRGQHIDAYHDTNVEETVDTVKDNIDEE